ncbi:LIM domain only protein 7b [Chanos chanos]|uniref:LIM domain only protein 7b n=1 Tax=Chanos chanos TaxID=29144 RepID=A0A6J2VT01_CHACN|nr:LIM domain only protein 7-like [Chanos chanos]
MEWREQSSVSCEVAFAEAQRWIEEVTRKPFGGKNFRSALENGVLLCDLLNRLSPGIIKRVNRLSTPIAGLDNVNVFLKACKKLGLNDAQLFHPGDLQDVSTRVTVRREETSRRLKNVLITIYWLGRKAQADRFYHGPQLNLKAFEGLLGVALSKALEESTCPKSSVRDSGYGETFYPDREELFSSQSGYRRENSVESLDSVESHTLSVASDNTLVAGSEGIGSDAEAEHFFRMSESRNARGDAQVSQGHVPAALRKKRWENNEDKARGDAGSLISEIGRDTSPSPDGIALPPASAFLQWANSYESDSDSDSDRPEPDLIQDDLASRRFRSTPTATPHNFAIPPKPRRRGPILTVTPRANRSWVAISDASRLPVMSGVASPVPSENTFVNSVDEEFYLMALNAVSSDSDEDRGFADPIQDDLYTRRILQTLHQTSSNTEVNKFLPKYWTPEEEVFVRTIKLGSQRRPWYRKMQGFSRKTSGSSEEDSDYDITPWLATPARTLAPPSNSSHTQPMRSTRNAGSKSTGDITEEHMTQSSAGSRTFDSAVSDRIRQGSLGDLTLEPMAIREIQKENLDNVHARLRESEAQWQEDLTKWKNRRRSTNSALRRKKEERERFELLASGGGDSVDRTKVLREVQENSEDKSPSSLGSSSKQQLTSEFKPHNATVLTDTHTTENISSSTSAKGRSNLALLRSQTPVLGDRTHMSSTGSPVPYQSSMPGPMRSSGPSGTDSTAQGKSQTSSTDTFGSGPEPDQQQLQQQLGPSSARSSPIDPSWTGARGVSASLPRGYRRSESGSRLSTGVTPRPFGAKSRLSLSRSHGERGSWSSAPPSFKEVKDGRLSAPPTRSLISKIDNSGPKQFVPPNSVSENGQTEETVQDRRSSGVTCAVAPLSQVRHSDMRVSLNQKPNSARDFGFQTHWDSTGARITSIQPGSPAELCQLQVGDEILAVGGRRVADMNYEQWKASTDAALQKGSLLMDVRRYGQDDWGSGHTSLPYKSHKTINLTSADSTLIGRPDHYVDVRKDSSSALDSTVKPQLNGQSVNGFSSNVLNGGLSDDPLIHRHKEYELIALKNRKRRSEFFKRKGSSGFVVSSSVYLCGGSESAISDLKVPSIGASSSSSPRWSWDSEVERKRQEKWQMEQERLLQEKCRRDQERLEEEWRRAQREATGEYDPAEEPRSMGLTNGYSDFRSPVPPSNQSTSLPYFASNQHAEEMQARDRMSVRIASVAKVKEHTDGPATGDQWKKSKSTPSLQGIFSQETKGALKDLVKKKRQMSQAERERLQLLEEMRKKNHLLTDNSWIRQRSSSNIYKEPITVGTPFRRHESLENLHSNSSWVRPFSSSSNPRPHSAIGNVGAFRGPGRYSVGPSASSSSFRPSPWSYSTAASATPPPEESTTGSHPNLAEHGRVVSGRQKCWRCKLPLGKGAAMVIESLDLCFHLGCFKCISCMRELGTRSESGAQVRIRNKQLFCDFCYARLRVRPGFPK